MYQAREIRRVRYHNVSSLCRRDQAQHHPEEREAGDEGGVFSLLTGHRLRRGLRLPGAHRHGEQGHGSEDLRQPRCCRAATGTKAFPSTDNSASVTCLFFIMFTMLANLNPVSSVTDICPVSLSCEI